MKRLNFVDNGLLKFNYDFPVFNWFYPYYAEDLTNKQIMSEITDNTMNIFKYILDDPSDVALYFHIPFCQDICSFCPFNREILKEQNRLDAYIQSLIKEIDIKKEYINAKHTKINSIFFGGGTPSIMTVNQIRTIGKKIKESFDLSLLKEFSFEMNAKSISEEKAIALKNIGVTHVRVGVQTFSEKYRKLFCLTATLKQIYDGIAILKRHFDNVSVDILYGFNGETMHDFLIDLKKTLDLNVPNISLYPLNNKSIQDRLINKYEELGLLPCSGLDRLGFKILAKEFMARNGYYPHNGHDFVKVKEQPKRFITDEYKFEYHKSVYGSEKSELIGFGVSAISFFNGFITMNDKSIDQYINDFNIKGYCNMFIRSYDKILDVNKPISLYLPYHGSIKKDDINLDRISKELVEQLKVLIEKKLVIETENEFLLTEVGWLSYVNILFYLSPILDKKYLIGQIEKTEQKRNIGLWNFEL